jgi:hypothetical protein
MNARVELGYTMIARTEPEQREDWWEKQSEEDEPEDAHREIAEGAADEMGHGR